LFHYPAKSAAGKWFVFFSHGVHHDDPQDPTRLVMPPFVSLALGFLFYNFFKLVLGPWADLTFAFFVSGYLFYDFTHFAVHHFKPKTFIGRFLKENHMLHHFADHDSRWGVSSPLWDQILGTTGKPKSNKSLETKPGES
jgi:sterol desaturase/sphingolipid hydroxylase (fatty acid hydroxylase superfamily)